MVDPRIEQHRQMVSSLVMSIGTQPLDDMTYHRVMEVARASHYGWLAQYNQNQLYRAAVASRVPDDVPYICPPVTSMAEPMHVAAKPRFTAQPKALHRSTLHPTQPILFSLPNDQYEKQKQQQKQKQIKISSS
jgi:hypothetical protein